MLTRRQLLLLGGAATAAMLPAAASAEDAGQVTALMGRAVAQAGGSERPLAVGAQVQVGDLVQTAADSRLGLRLGQSTIINLGPATRLRIERHLVDAGGQFDLVEGSILFAHTRPAGTQPHKAEVRSPYGLIAVRGTRFWAGQQQGRFGVFVAEGAVDVTAADRSVRLHPGFGTDIMRPGLRPTAAAVWPSSRIRNAYLSTLGALPKQP